MATTRYYLSTTPSSLTPAFDGAWSTTTTGSRFQAVTSKTDTALALYSKVTLNRAIFLQYITDLTGVINFNGGKFNLSIGTSRGAKEKFAGGILTVGLRLLHSAGGFTTLLSVAQYDTDFNALSARIVSNVSLPNISSLSDDRLICEIGVTPSQNNNEFQLQIGDVIANSDYPLTSGATGTYDGWFELKTTTNQILFGSLSFSGALLLKPSHLYFTAALSFVGSLPNIVSSLHFPSAVLNLSGSVAKNIRRALSASLTSSAILNRFISFHQTATLSFSGFFRGVRNLYLPATLSFVGANTRAISKRIASSLNFFGSTLISKVGGGIQYLFAFGSNLLFSTSSQKAIFSGQQSTLNLQSGQAGKVITKGMSAGLSLTASFNVFINLLRSAMRSTLNFSVIFTQLKGKFFTAVLNLSGNIPGKKIFSMQSSTLNLSGFTPKFIVTGIFNAILNFIGSRVDSIQLLVQGATEMDLRVQGAEAMLLTVKFDPNFTGDIP